jgi:hypothetical protein
MKETQIEKLRQIISRTDKSGNEKVDLLLSLFREHSAKILEPYKEYITLLEKAEASALSIASIHHYRVSDDLIKKGQELRDKIKNQELSENLVCMSKEDLDFKIASAKGIELAEFRKWVHQNGISSNGIKWFENLFNEYLNLE